MKALSLALAGAMLGLGGALVLAQDVERTVKITEMGFSPDRMEIMAGQKVVWRNTTLKDHNVICPMRCGAREAQEKEKPLFDSGVIKPGASFVHTFAEAGTFEYFCGLDQSMRGTVVVKTPSP